MIGSLLLNRYRIEAELGQGGMGAVYRALDTLLNRTVAIKLLSRAGSGGLDTEGRARLLREAQAAAQLNHSNIVAIYDAGEADIPGQAGRLPFIVMELVQGPSLYERRPAAFPEIIAIARQICAALAHAHRRGIIHRDLKPENIVLTPSGRAKLTDFGLARSISSRLTMEGAIVGTVFYLAPEAALGKPVDGRADLYSLGVILYELAAGRLPYTADDPLAVISQHLYAPLVPPRAHRPEIPAGLNDLIVQLLSKEPDGRPALADDVERQLEILETTTRIEPGRHEVGQALPALDRLARGRLVGRTRELAEMTAAWKLASIVTDRHVEFDSAAEPGQVVLLSGEPGIGKTRLVRELMAHVAVSGGRTLAGSCYAEGGIPYAPLPELLQETLRETPGNLGLPDFVLADLATLAPQLRSQDPDLPRATALEVQVEQTRLFESVLAWLEALAAGAPVLLFLDDVHWADSGLLYLVRHLARRAARLRVLIILTYREIELNEASPLENVLTDLMRGRLATRIKLTRLDREQTGEMLRTILSPAGEISDSLVEAIYRETEGNPFFIEEVTKALIEEGKLCYEDVCWVASSAGEIEIPQSVRLTVQSRLSRLPTQAQEVLRTAAILGREFDFETLKHASELDEDSLIVALETAERAQIIDELPRRRAMALSFSFAHALIPATLRDATSGLRRQRLHRRAALAIEATHPEADRRSALYETLAYHYEQAGDARRARAYYRQAGDRALAVFANQEAERHFRAALELSEEETEVSDLLTGLGEALFRQSRFEPAIDAWQDAIQRARQQGDLDSAARLYARSARAAWYSGDAASGLALCREGLRLAAPEALAGIETLPAGERAEPKGSPPGQAVIPEIPGVVALIHETARALRFNGLNEPALPLCRQALEMAGRLGLVEIQAEALATLGILPNQPPEDAQQALEQAVQLAESAGLLTVAARANLNLGGHLQGVGQFRASLVYLNRARELAQRMGIASWEFDFVSAILDTQLNLANLDEVETGLQTLHQLVVQIPNATSQLALIDIIEAGLWASRGEWPRAVELLEQARTNLNDSKDQGERANAYLQLGVAWLEMNRLAEAEESLVEAVRLSGGKKDEKNVYLQALFAALRLAQGRIGDASDLLQAARRSFETHPLPILDLNLLWFEAILAARQGRWEGSQAAFQRATGLSRDFGMRWSLARINLDWAEAYAARDEPGDADQARERFQESLKLFEEIGSPGYIQRVKERSKLLFGSLSTP